MIINSFELLAAAQQAFNAKGLTYDGTTLRDDFRRYQAFADTHPDRNIILEVARLPKTKIPVIVLKAA